MEQKKEYTEPKMDVITLESQSMLLDNSTEVGFAPSSSDPKDLA